MDLREFDDFLQVEGLPILVKNTGKGIYDFDFRNYFSCKSVNGSVEHPVLLRIGAIDCHEEIRNMLNEIGMELLVGQAEQEREFGFPVFVKGNRQTNRHKKQQCIIENAEMYEALKKDWVVSSILHWQKVMIRKYIPLEKVDDTSYPDMIPFSYEFRVFLWRKEIVGIGRYWYMGQDYSLRDKDREAVMKLARTAGEIMNVTFLVVDVAKTAAGQWIIIEVNDGQESGYAGVSPYALWQRILQIEGEKACV